MQGMWKQCRAPGCSGLTRKGKYCEKHLYLEKKERSERMRYYNQNIRQSESQAFYESTAWRKLRQQKLNQMPLCEICYKNGHLEKATIVDHIIEIKDGGEALDMSNLQSVCQKCHNQKTAKERAKRNKGEIADGKE